MNVVATSRALVLIDLGSGVMATVIFIVVVCVVSRTKRRALTTKALSYQDDYQQQQQQPQDPSQPQDKIHTTGECDPNTNTHNNNTHDWSFTLGTDIEQRATGDSQQYDSEAASMQPIVDDDPSAGGVHRGYGITSFFLLSMTLGFFAIRYPAAFIVRSGWKRLLVRVHQVLVILTLALPLCNAILISMCCL
jgi:hypothetical protein